MQNSYFNIVRGKELKAEEIVKRLQADNAELSPVLEDLYKLHAERGLYYSSGLKVVVNDSKTTYVNFLDELKANSIKRTVMVVTQTGPFGSKEFDEKINSIREADIMSPQDLSKFVNCNSKNDLQRQVDSLYDTASKSKADDARLKLLVFTAKTSPFVMLMRISDQYPTTHPFPDVFTDSPFIGIKLKEAILKHPGHSPILLLSNFITLTLILKTYASFLFVFTPSLTLRIAM